MRLLPLLFLTLSGHDIGNGNGFAFDRMSFHKFNEPIERHNSWMLGRIFRGEGVPVVRQLDNQRGPVFAQLRENRVLQGYTLSAPHCEASGDALESRKHKLCGLLSVDGNDRLTLSGDHPFNAIQHPGFLRLIESWSIGIVGSPRQFFECCGLRREHQRSFQCGINVFLQIGSEHGSIEYPLRILHTRLIQHSQGVFCTGTFQGETA